MGELELETRGMAGGYAYKRIQFTGDARSHNKSNKHRFSHPCEVAPTMMLGASEGRTAMPRPLIGHANVRTPRGGRWYS
jgi:hypothetical protein